MTASKMAQVALLIASIVLLGSSQTTRVDAAESRSMFSQIPGVGFLTGLSDEVVNLLSSAVEKGASSLSNQVRSFESTGTGQLIDECLDDIQCLSGAEKDPDTKRNVFQIITSRGFVAEEHDVTTRDGYILTIQRIINPLVEPDQRRNLKPVILQHGLMSSSVDWVINSVDVHPTKPGASNASDEVPNTVEGHHQDRTSSRLELNQRPIDAISGDSQQHPNSLGFYLANEGYDVFLANSRGNIYGQRHVKLSSWNPKFWDFTFDEQIKYDLPDVIEYVQHVTNHTKVGYVGHSQGTTMIFGLLADQPEYADVVEPIVALAPVAYVSHCLSPVRYFSMYTPIFQHIDMWFGSSNAVVRYLGPIVCGPHVIRKELCANIIFLSCGFDEAEFDQSRVSAYLSHMPSGTSVKNIAHWGQMVNSGRFARFDHGILGNQVSYGVGRAPDYDLAKIRSKSISLFTAENDWLASPLDVARLKSELGEKPFRVVNVTEDLAKWNHIDFVYGKHAGQLVNRRIVDIFQHFRP